MGEQTTLDDTRNTKSSSDNTTSKNTTTQSSDRSSSPRGYTKIYKSDIWEFVVDSPWYFVEVDIDNTNEYVFEIRYTSDNSPVDDPIAIRWYTSVDKRTEVSRPVGTDAMRLVLVDLRVNKPILKQVRTHRIETWRENLTEKIHRIENQFQSLPECPECGSVLVIVTRHTGKQFRGCSRYYPKQECTYSESL